VLSRENRRNKNGLFLFLKPYIVYDPKKYLPNFEIEIFNIDSYFVFYIIYICGQRSINAKYLICEREELRAKWKKTVGGNWSWKEMFAG
jgi:hypothetical protein